MLISVTLNQSGVKIRFDSKQIQFIFNLFTPNPLLNNSPLFVEVLFTNDELERID